MLERPNRVLRTSLLLYLATVYLGAVMAELARRSRAESALIAILPSRQVDLIAERGDGTMRPDSQTQTQTQTQE